MKSLNRELILYIYFNEKYLICQSFLMITIGKIGRFFTLFLTRRNTGPSDNFPAGRQVLPIQRRVMQRCERTHSTEKRKCFQGMTCGRNGVRSGANRTSQQLMGFDGNQREAHKNGGAPPPVCWATGLHCGQTAFIQKTVNTVSPT